MTLPERAPESIRGWLVIVEVALPDFRLVAANRAAESMLAAIGSDSHDIRESLLAPMDRAHVGSIVEGVGDTGEEKEFACSLLGPDGRPVEAYGVARRIEDDRVELVLVPLGGDVSRAVRDVAESALRSRDGVLAVVSHDLRNPLSAILTTTAILKIRVGSQVGKQLETIQRAAERMHRLINDLLDLQKIESGGFSVNVAPHAIEVLLAEARDTFTPLAERRGLDLSIGDASGGALVTCDRDRVLQVISNLVGNALKFTPPPGRVEIKAHLEGSQAIFAVNDTGPGIPLPDQPRVFDRYWKGNRTESEGIGLGLTIARALVLAHGGKIWLDSRPGNGATFLFTLPLARR